VGSCSILEVRDGGDGRRRSEVTAVVVLVASIALILAACSSSSGSSQSRGIAPGSAALSDSQLRQLLLTKADVPDGFRNDATQTADTTSSRLCGRQTLQALATHHGAASTTFLAGPDGPGIVEQLLSYGTVDAAKSAIDAARAASSCHSFDQRSAAGAVTHWSVNALSFPKLGDDQMSQALSGTFPGGTGSVDIVIARFGRVVMLIGGISTSLAARQLKGGQLTAAALRASRAIRAAG
jgi:hypothetical protein